MKVFDMHCDTFLFISRENGVSLKKNDICVDVEKLREGGYALQNFAMFVDSGKCADQMGRVNEMIDSFHAELLENSDRLAPVFSYEDILRNMENCVISAFLTVENGGVTNGEIERLHELYHRGVRMITITWNYDNAIGSPNIRADGEKIDIYTPELSKGLTPVGIEFIHEMQNIGVIADVSHLSDKGFYDVVQHTDRPFVASHSNSRHICPVARNLTDSMIKKLADCGGVTGVNICGDFLRGGREVETMRMMAEHLRHIADVGGYDCIGLGTDFDGVDTPEDFSGAHLMPELIPILEGYGFSDDQIEKIFYKNVLRVYKDTL